MTAVEARALAARIGLHTLCSRAKLSGTIATRWLQKGKAPLLHTIGKLERELVNVERENGA